MIADGGSINTEQLTQGACKRGIGQWNGFIQECSRDEVNITERPAVKCVAYIFAVVEN